MKRSKILVLAALSALVVSCTSTGGKGDDKAISKGINAWNTREPSAATAYWNDIADSSTKNKYLNYVTLYDAGVKALDSTDSIKSTNEPKLLSACNTALDKFSAIGDDKLELPGDVCDKGTALSAERIEKLLAAEKISQAKKMHTTSVKVYGTSDALTLAQKKIDVVSSISSKKSNLESKGEKAKETEGFDERIAALKTVLADYDKAEADAKALANKNGVGSENSIAANLKRLRSSKQDLNVFCQGLIREKAYEYKDRFGEEFARQPAGDPGKMSLYDIRNHYKTIQNNIDGIYTELIAFRDKYPKDLPQDVINDIDAQRQDLKRKISQINAEIAHEEEVKSRGKTVMPLMIGLFNPEPGTKAESKKSRPAKFSATNASKDEYWWGMVSIPKGQMNDLVITLKDNRTVRVFNENTKSGKRIEKDGLKNLVNMSSKVGNSWPVLNAGNQLTSDKYFFEVQKGKTDSYSGEVVVYSSFVVRKR